MLAQYYKLRPDIFIQRAPGKLRIKRQDENYILSLNNDFIDIVLDFLEKADGESSLDKLLSQYQGNIKSGLEKINNFLINKNLAFFQSEDQKIFEPGLFLVENYLSQYTDNIRLAYEKFSKNRFLVVASDIELHGLTRTLAEFGARDVDFINVNKTSTITSDKIVQNFNKHSCVDGASIREVSLSGMNANTGYDVVVTTEVSVVEQLNAIPGAFNSRVYFVAMDKEHLVLHKNTAYADVKSSPITKTKRLVAGAVMGSAIFDDLSGVKTFNDKEYAYYSLDACNILRLAQFTQLQKVELPAAESKLDILKDLDTFLLEPMFPVTDCRRIAHAVDMLNIQAIEINDQTQPELANITYYGIGLDETEARADALENYLLINKSWFHNDVNYPSLAKKIQANEYNSHPVVNELANISAYTKRISRQTEFLMFCINGTFDCELVLKTAQQAGQPVLIAEASGEVVTTSISDSDEQSLTKVLLRLYLNLWLAQNQANVVRISGVPEQPLLKMGGSRDE